MTQRENWIDWSKSICMFLVILGHTHLDDSGLMIKKIIYTFHMPLFFFLSGCLCKKSISKQSLIRDVKFILIPYFFFGILGIIIPHPRSLQDAHVYLYYLFAGYDSSIGAIWFLPAIFICKQLGTIITSIQSKCNWLFLLTMGLLFVLTYLLHNINMPFFSCSAILGLPFFLIGHIFMKYYKSLLSSQSQFPFIFLFVFVLSVIVTITLANKHEFVALAGHSYGDNIFLYYINAIAGISSIISVSILLNKYYFHFVFVTSYGSISILWTHGVFLTFLQYHLFCLLNIEISAYPIWMAVVFSTFTYLCCYVCTIIFGLKGSLTKYKKTNLRVS